MIYKTFKFCLYFELETIYKPILKIMRAYLLLFFALLFSGFTFAQDIPARWDELVAGDFTKAIEKSSKTCILPIGILEKHGPPSPIGTDLTHVREWAARAVKS